MIIPVLYTVKLWHGELKYLHHDGERQTQEVHPGLWIAEPMLLMLRLQRDWFAKAAPPSSISPLPHLPCVSTPYTHWLLAVTGAH